MVETLILIIIGLISFKLALDARKILNDNAYQVINLYTLLSFAFCIMFAVIGGLCIAGIIYFTWIHI